MPRQWVEGHVLTRHDELVVARHPEGDCAAEATAFATGKPHVGEAVAAARALKEKEGMRLHDVHEAVQPHGYELRTELRGHEEAGALTFVRVCTSLRSGIHLLQTTVRGRHGERREHLMVWDAWRRLIFLGAGELSEEWIAGVIGVQSADLRGSVLDDRLRDELRVLGVSAVRSLWERPSVVERVSASDVIMDGGMPSCGKRKRPSKKARDRERMKRVCTYPPLPCACHSHALGRVRFRSRFLELNRTRRGGSGSV
jgi:hypothetical protein